MKPAFPLAKASAQQSPEAAHKEDGAILLPNVDTSNLGKSSRERGDCCIEFIELYRGQWNNVLSAFDSKIGRH